MNIKVDNNPKLVISPTIYFVAPMFSAKIGKKPKVTPKVTNCIVIPTEDTSRRNFDLVAFKDFLKE